MREDQGDGIALTTNAPPPAQRLRATIYRIVFEADSPAGKAFDVALILGIVCSVGVVMLDSVRSIREPYGEWLYALEWCFTVLFTIEYALRLYCVARPLRYARSFFGIVDLLAILPTYLSLLIPGTQYLLVIRVLRVLRVFRVLKIAQYVGEANTLMRALRASRRKIFVFFFGIMTLVIVLGSVMYLIEGETNGFTSIPVSVYWAVVTLTTVGFGDITPKTPVGQALAALVMILGYAIIAVPTGIVTVEMNNLARLQVRRACADCGHAAHDADAQYCKRCGSTLESRSPQA